MPSLSVFLKRVLVRHRRERREFGRLLGWHRGGCTDDPQPGSTSASYNCGNGVSDNQNRLILSSTDGRSVLDAGSNPVGSAPALSCTFTVSDAYGHTAQYTVSAPAQ